MRFFLLVTASLVLIGCGGGGGGSQAAIPAVVFSRAKTAFLRGDFKRSLEEFRRTEALLPPSAPELAEVQFHVAESQYGMGDHLEAAQTFRRLADRFPRHNLAPLALLRAGDANAELWRRPELDPTYGAAALAAYRELVGRYPSSDAALRAQVKARKLTEDFAAKQYKAGQFYLSRKAYDSAIIYFRDLIVQHSQSALVPEAYLRLIDAYDAIGYRAELEQTCQFLRQQHPDAARRADQCSTVN